MPGSTVQFSDIVSNLFISACARMNPTFFGNEKPVRFDPRRFQGPKFARSRVVLAFVRAFFLQCLIFLTKVTQMHARCRFRRRSLLGHPNQALGISPCGAGPPNTAKSSACGRVSRSGGTRDDISRSRPDRIPPGSGRPSTASRWCLASRPARGAGQGLPPRPLPNTVFGPWRPFCETGFIFSAREFT